MAVAHPISEHDVVRLREAVHGWPAGTVGTVVSDYCDVVLVEVASETGKALEFVQVPVAQLELKLIEGLAQGSIQGSNLSESQPT